MTQTNANVPGLQTNTSAVIFSLKSIQLLPNSWFYTTANHIEHKYELCYIFQIFSISANYDIRYCLNFSDVELLSFTLLTFSSLLLSSQCNDCCVHRFSPAFVRQFGDIIIVKSIPAPSSTNWSSVKRGQ